MNVMNEERKLSADVARHGVMDACEYAIWNG